MYILYILLEKGGGGWAAYTPSSTLFYTTSNIICGREKLRDKEDRFLIVSPIACQVCTLTMFVLCSKEERSVDEEMMSVIHRALVKHFVRENHLQKVLKNAFCGQSGIACDFAMYQKRDTGIALSY